MKSLVILAALLALPCAGLQAQERRGHERAGPPAEFRSAHWHYDDRYHHAHYYPAIGYSIAVLPAGVVTIGFGGGRLYFHGGVFYRPAGAAFVVVRPPFGLVVPVLPPAYATVWFAGAPYYYANETYYAAAPGGAGYTVVAPPPGAEPTTESPLPPPAAPSSPEVQAPRSSAQPTAGSWYYCESAKAYYPYVQQCQEGWRAVPAVPPGAPSR